MLKTLNASAALFLLLCAGTAHALPNDNLIEFKNCTLATPGSPLTASARCGFLEVPENPAEPGGRIIRLHIAVAEAVSQDQEPDPLFFFAGGPGQAATETWPMIRSALRKIRKKRDIVMIDQRGTGESNSLRCETETGFDLNAEIDFEEIAAEAAECAGELDADPRFYTTTIAMQDYERVRQAMGYGEINLMGVSYGTRAAQVYLRQFPESVRTVTLDSVVPMQLALGQEHAPMLDRAVQAVLDDCEREASCSERFPGQKQELDDLFATLREQPRRITIPNPVTGQEQEIRVTAETLAVAIRFLSYSSETQALLPLLIHEAVTTGRLGRLASQAILVMSDIDEMISRGMEMSVMCSEDYPYLDLEADYGDTIIGNMMLRGIEAQCGAWPRGPVPKDFHEPVRSQVPVVLIAGERDPVTPPHYAAQAAETFPNSLELVATGHSHSVLRLVCLQEIVTQFIESGSVESLDTACVDDIRPAPFFTSLLGPDP